MIGRRLLMTGTLALLVGCGSMLQAEDKKDDKAPKADKKGFYQLFNGKNLDGWKIAENPKAFKVEDGKLVVGGNRGHLFYAGKVKDAKFKNFIFEAELMTKPKANSGLYFHTKFQDKGWPAHGYECQVNNTHGDPKKTASLYDVKNNLKEVAKDNKWYKQTIIVVGKRIILKVNDKVITDFTEPENVNYPGWPNRKLSEGTFAIQAHDPGSVVYYKSIKVKPLPDDAKYEGEGKKG